MHAKSFCIFNKANKPPAENDPSTSPKKLKAGLGVLSLVFASPQKMGQNKLPEKLFWREFFPRDPQPTLETSSRRRKDHVLHCCIPGKIAREPRGDAGRMVGKLLEIAGTSTVCLSVSPKIPIPIEGFFFGGWKFIRTDTARKKGFK